MFITTVFFKFCFFFLNTYRRQSISAVVYNIMFYDGHNCLKRYPSYLRALSKYNYL